MRLLSEILKSGFGKFFKLPSFNRISDWDLTQTGHSFCALFPFFCNKSTKMGLLPVKPDLQRIGDAT